MAKNKGKEKFIQEATLFYGDKYDYSKVEYKGYKDEVCIICKKCGNVFWQRPKNHLRNNGCPICSKAYIGRTKTIHNTVEFIKKAKEVHGYRYNYSQVNYIDTKTKVCIICPSHGAFSQSPISHIRGRGCPMCAQKQRLTKEHFIERGIKAHGLKYDYSKVQYKNLKEKVEIICPKHGSFWQSPVEHFKGYGCVLCSIEDKVVRRNKWTFSSVYDTARRFTNLKDFREQYPTAYTYARKNKMFDIINRLKKERKSWTIEDVIEESKKYTSRVDFCRESHTAYLIALKNDLLKDMIWLVPKTTNYKNAHVIYSYSDDIHKAIYIGQTLRPKERDLEHRKNEKSSVNKYFSAMGLDIPNMNIIETNLQDIESQIRENYWVEYYKSIGYKIINIAKTGYGSSSLGLARIKWTKSKIFKEASKYKSLGEFRERNNSAYQTACRKKYIQEISDKFNWKLRVKWNKDTCLYYFAQCKNISEFKNKHSAGYKYAIKNGIQLIK